MANKFDGDVRPLSNDPRYMGTVFSGPMDEALAQARAAKDYGLPKISLRATCASPFGVSRNRLALLQHLNLVPL